MSDRTKLRRWALLSAALFVLLAIWGAANPMFASPDETVHMVRAQGFADLDFSNPYRTDGIPIDEVRCYRFDPELSARCMNLVWPEGTVEIDASSTDGYPPLLHIIAAVPAVAVDGLGGAYVMRWWTALVVAAGFGFAAMLVTRPTMGRWPLVALVVAMTPQVLFIASSVNPSGIAAAAGAMLAAGLVSLSTPYRRSREVRAAIAVGALALVTNRRDGIVMLVAVAAATAPLWVPGLRASAGSALGRLRGRSTAVTVVAVAVAVATVVFIGRWGAYAVDFVRNPGSRRDTAGFTQALGTIPGYVSEMIGRFGWLDTPVGPVFVSIGVVLVAVLVLLALAVSPLRLAMAVLWALMVVAAVVVASEMIEYTYLQARYVFPVWLAALISVGVVLDRSEVPERLTRRLSAIMLALWAVLQFGALYTNQRRYSVGLSEAWDFSALSQWEPPMLTNTELLLAFAVALIGAGAGWWWLWRDDRAPIVADPAGAERDLSPVDPAAGQIVDPSGAPAAPRPDEVTT